jgi:hypothetical protein
MTKPSRPIHPIIPALPANERRPNLICPTGDRGAISGGWGPKI